LFMIRRDLTILITQPPDLVPQNSTPAVAL
jgi:hypothetical protein